MLKKITLLFAVVVLASCSKPVPIKLNHHLQDYIGTWQFRFEDIQKQEIRIDNMLLILNENGSGKYRRCVVHVTKTSHSRKSFRSSVEFPDAVITRIENSTLSLAQKTGWFHFDSDLKIDRAPYQENGQWYLQVEGKKLSKIAAEDGGTKTGWHCPSSVNEEDI